MGHEVAEGVYSSNMAVGVKVASILDFLKSWSSS